MREFSVRRTSSLRQMARKWQHRRGWLLRRRPRCWRSALALAQTARFGARGRRAAGRRRDAAPLRLVCDGQVQRRRVRVPIRGWNMASQVLLGRLHRRDGMRRLMLRFRELLDVVLRRVELPRSRSISCGAAARCALFGAVAADCSSNRSRPSAFDQAKASTPMTPRPSATMARFKSRAPVRPAASSPSSSTSKLATKDPPDAATGFIALSAMLVKARKSSREP